MKRRRRHSKLARVRIFDSTGGVCCLCQAPIGMKRWIGEHIVPLWLGGADDESNLGPAHEDCARKKTRAEAGVRKKVYRMRAKYLGVKRRQRRPMPGTIASGWRKRFDGTVERR